MSTTTPADAINALDAQLTDVATALYGVDSSGDTLFARSQADAGNAAAVAALESLATAWDLYPRAKAAMERLHDAWAASDHAAIVALLGPAAVTLPDGTATGIATLLADVRGRAESVARDVTRMAESARQALSRLDAARAAIDEITIRAAVLRSDDDPEIVAAKGALERATATVAADPTTSPDLADLERLTDVARARVTELEQQRTGLPADLAAARQQRDQIEALALRATEARAVAEAKIASPAGLLPAPDPSHLRPQLDDIERFAAAGDWAGASAALAGWKADADRLLDAAQRAAKANAAPVARRNELRGLLDAYKAKALAHGRDEDGRLARLHAAAQDALYTAPCALDRAEPLVQEYVAAVNAAARGGE